MAGKQTKRRPIYAARIDALLRECSWRDEDLAHATGISARTLTAVRLGRSASIRHSTATLISQAFSRRLGRAITIDFVRGERGSS